MSWLLELRLIRFFEFYLALMFCVSTALRVRQYRVVVGLVRKMPGRWPRLLKLLRGHYNLFLTWGTLLPTVLAGGLLLTHTLASRLVWPAADLPVSRLLELWPALVPICLSGAAMVGVDVYCTSRVAPLDQALLEKYFDQAEYWLKAWTAPVVRFFTLGYINPRRIVAQEVRTALESCSKMLNGTLWWVILQTGLRILFGLSLWITYALDPAFRS